MTPHALLPALFGFLVAGAVASHTYRRITYISADQTVNIGDTAQLQCTVPNVADYTVAWARVYPENPQRRVLISENSILHSENLRYRVRTDPVNSTYYLQISDIRDTDDGLYKCELLLYPSNNKITAEVKLLVRTPPVFIPNSTNTVTATQGVSVKLQCYAQGYPPPQVTWRRENNVAFYSGNSSISGNVLNFENITKDDRGLYFCVADNGVGKKVKHSIEVNVKFAPIINAPRPRVGQALHYNADLDCNVESYPTAAIYWLKNTTILYASAKYTTSAFSTPNGHVSSVLRIVDVEPQDYGTYICNAANELGSSDALVELFETNDPVCPPACNVRPVKVQSGSATRATSGKVHNHT